jgi:hypothetical protein
MRILIAGYAWQHAKKRLKRAVRPRMMAELVQTNASVRSLATKKKKKDAQRGL